MILCLDKKRGKDRMLRFICEVFHIHHNIYCMFTSVKQLLDVLHGQAVKTKFAVRHVCSRLLAPDAVIVRLVGSIAE